MFLVLVPMVPQRRAEGGTGAPAGPHPPYSFFNPRNPRDAWIVTVSAILSGAVGIRSGPDGTGPNCRIA